jgi:hypothetical protein
MSFQLEAVVHRMDPEDVRCEALPLGECLLSQHSAHHQCEDGFIQMCAWVVIRRVVRHEWWAWYKQGEQSHLSLTHYCQSINLMHRTGFICRL